MTKLTNWKERQHAWKVLLVQHNVRHGAFAKRFNINPSLLSEWLGASKQANGKSEQKMIEALNTIRSENE